MTRYPLTWPNGWRRTAPGKRRYGHFHTTERRTTGENGSARSIRETKNLTVYEAVGRVLESLRLFGVHWEDVLISTNLVTRLDGLPRANQPEPKDPGVAVYWQPKGATIPKVLAVDMYTKVEQNLGAVAATLEAMRAIDRHGGATILERAFLGFTALPSPNDWRHVMGFEDTPSLEEAERRYKKLAGDYHPDRGGNGQRMAELNIAIQDARRELQEVS